MGKSPNSPRRSTQDRPSPYPDLLCFQTRSITPELSDAIASLPPRLLNEQKLFLNPYIDQFKPHVGKRGARGDNATSWARSFTVNHFIPEFFPNDDLNEADITCLCEKVYNYLHNSAKRGSRAKPQKPAVQLRFFAHDSWRKAEPKAHDDAVLCLVAKLFPDIEPNFGEKRALTPKAFQNLPDHEKAHWKKVAQKEQTACQAATRLVDPLDIERYSDGLLKTLNSVIADATKKIGACVTIQLVTKKDDNRFKLSSLSSDNLGDFNKSDALAIYLNAMKDYVESSNVDVIIDWKTGKALVPECAGMSVAKLRRLLRKLVKYQWALQGGVGSVPWDEISRNVAKWIDPKRLPPGVEFKDTGYLSLSSIVTLINWIDLGHKGGLDNGLVFQFYLVNAGCNPIDQAASEETSRELVKVNSRDVYFLTFKNLVTRCHAVGGIDAMPFSENAIAYTHFRQTGQLHLNRSLSYLPPADWVGLPFGAEIPRVVFSGAEAETMSTLASMLPEEHSSRLSNLIQLVNEHQSHLPASDKMGIWNCPKAPPEYIPQTPCNVPQSPFFYPANGPACFYKPPLALEGTIGYLEIWYESLWMSQVLIHQPSGTLYGGDRSIGWLTRTLAYPYISVGAARYNIELPGPMPEGYDASRLPISEWPRLVNWVDTTALRIRDSIAILQRTSNARALGLSPTYISPHLNHGLNTNADPDTDPLLESSEPVAGPILMPESHRALKRKGKKALHRIESDEEDDENLDGDDSGDHMSVDYETLDRSPDADNNGGEAFHGSFLVHDVQVATCSDPGPSTMASRPNTTKRATRPQALWRQRANAFGKFLILNKYKPPTIPLSHDSIMEALDKGDRIWATARRDFELICSMYHAPLEVDLSPLDTFNDSHARILGEYVLRRCAIWSRTELLAKSLFEIDLRIYEFFRNMVIASGRARLLLDMREEQAINHGTFFPETLLLETRMERSNSSLVESRWGHIELLNFEHLATQNLNKLQGNWLQRPLPTDLSNLHRLVKHQLEWFDEFERLKHGQIEQRQKLWAEQSQGASPAQHTSSGMGFAFGNPSIAEEPIGLRDAFAQVTERLSNLASSINLHKTTSTTRTADTSADDNQMHDSPSQVSNAQTDPLATILTGVSLLSADSHVEASQHTPSLPPQAESGPDALPIASTQPASPPRPNILPTLLPPPDHTPIPSPDGGSPLPPPVLSASPLLSDRPSSPPPPDCPSSPPPGHMEQLTEGEQPNNEGKQSRNERERNASRGVTGRRVSARLNAIQPEDVQPVATRSVTKRATAATQKNTKSRKSSGR
ncbi:hypothetical protein RhiJN_05100 [Ceratobasidium sp. AG-Ba]|nr:hypothetical protein RhiJN_05100 [Ceratobasidium sp. AG-Ba]